MKRFVTFGLALALVGGCTELFGIEVPPLEQRSTTGGDAGLDAGSAGQAPADGGAGQTGTGGAGVSGQGAGGRSASGGSDAGGRHAGTSGSSSAGTEMLGGAGGATDEPDPKLGATCTQPGRLACVAPGSSPERLLCAGGAWMKGIACNTGETCDRRGGACGQVFPGCANPDDHVCVLENAVDGFYLFTCGPDLLSAEIIPCPFGCVDSDKEDDRCINATGGQLILEQPLALTTELAFWPEPTIPVCFVNPSDGPAAAIRDEIDRTWGRFGGVSFNGWNECPDEPTGVTVKFVALEQGDECVDELGSIDRIGYPGATGTVNVTLCLRYVDARPRPRSASEALLRLVARHEFGHVLGFDDVVKDYHPLEFMARAIDEDRIDAYDFEASHAARLQLAYGRKPGGALVDTLGNCLTATEGDILSFDHCDGRPVQAFYVENGQLWSAGADKCLHADASTGAVDLATCEPAGSSPPAEQLWRADAVDVVGFGGHCTFPQNELVDCVLFPGSLLWSPEFVDGGRRIRLHLNGYNRCAFVVKATDTNFAVYDLPDELEQPCDTCLETDPDCPDADRFELTTSGHLEIDGQCLAVPVTGPPEEWSMPGTGGVEVAPCAEQPRMIWNLSGRFANAAGRVLSRSTSGTPTLVTHPIEDEPSPNDILDFYLSKAE